MIGRRIFLIAGAAIATVPGNQSGAADAPQVVETKPANGAKIDGAATDYYVRFNRQIDHIHSVLLIKQNGAVVRRLEPRFDTAPELLFARGAELKPGNYTFHWMVKTLAGAEITEGETRFSVGH
jgi:methionine-rich copper-binding protein CopC